ncbi:MAG: TadE/TadG family type IV pilus assembly protein, partial [Gammaproteobacteria bacterium]
MNEHARMRGQAMVEFGVIIFVLLLLILGTLQFALIYHAKIQLNYAAFETARAGALNNARMWAMELAFARAMAPLYTTPYLDADCNGISYAFDAAPEPVGGDARPTDVPFNLDHVRCARQRVRDHAFRGAEWIKFYNHGDAEMVQAVVDEAHKHGRKVFGHFSKIGAAEAARLGVDSLEHTV